MSLNDENCVVSKITPCSALKQTCVFSVSPEKEKFLTRSVVVLCVYKSLLGPYLFSTHAWSRG